MAVSRVVERCVGGRLARREGGMRWGSDGGIDQFWRMEWRRWEGGGVVGSILCVWILFSEI